MEKTCGKKFEKRKELQDNKAYAAYINVIVQWVIDINRKRKAPNIF